MNHKPNFLQRIKGWAKLPKKKKHSMAGSMMNAVIKKQELVPIFKKASPPPLKPILKNQTNNNLKEIKLMLNQKFAKSKQIEAIKRNTMSDCKDDSKRLKNTSDSINTNPLSISEDNGSSITAKKNRSSSKELFRKNLEKLNDSVESRRKAVKSIVEDIESRLTTNIFRRTPSFNSTDDSQSSLNETTELNRNLKLINKEDTISMMNIFKKESSYIKFRQAAIKRFERLKRSKLTAWKHFRKTNLRCFSANTDVATSCSSEQNTFKVIMINKIEKFPSVCCIDVSKMSEGEKSLNKTDQTMKSNKSANNLQISSANMNSSADIVKNKSKEESIITVKAPATTVISKPHKKKGKH